MSPSGSASLTRRPWPVALAAGVALVLAAVVGAYLVFQPSASVPSSAVQRLAHVLVGLGMPWQTAADVVEFGLNVALFVPGAFAAALLWPRVRWWQWVLVGFAVTASIETLQGVLLDSRNAQVRDLVSNTLGAALGSGAALSWHRNRSSVARARPSI